MTVGIAAVCRQEGSLVALMAADRMVTVGNQGGVEYEDSESKIERLIDNDNVAATAVGSGVSTYLDEIFDQFEFLTQEGDGQLTSMEDVNKYLTAAYQRNVRQTIENQVTQPFGYTLQDLRDSDVQIPASVQQRLTEEVDGILEEVNKRVHILLCGVGVDGAKIYQIAGMDSTNFSDVGYSVVGSGSDSARLTFIRRQYDRTCSYREGVFTVLEAKDQAEERQGVGNRTDMVAINGDGIEAFDKNERSDLQDKLEDIEEAESDARENVMEEWDSN